jgi:hypothetical protein
VTPAALVRVLVAVVVGVAGSGGALACSPNPNPDLRPWAERVAGASPLFVGTVTEIRSSLGYVWTVPPKCETPGATPECVEFSDGFNDVVFTVEVPISADVERGDSFVIAQGHGSDCRVEFGLGQRWIYAGNTIESPSMYLNQSYDWEQAQLK